MSSPSRQKSWQSAPEHVSVLATLAIQKENVSRVLRELREQHKPPGSRRPLAIEKAAGRVGTITGRQWQRWESGESVPYLRNLEAVASEFDIPVGRFFGVNEEDDTTTSVLSLIDAVRDEFRSRVRSLHAKLDRIERNQLRVMQALNIRAPETDAPPIVPYPEADLAPGTERRGEQADRRAPGTHRHTGSEG